MTRAFLRHLWSENCYAKLERLTVHVNGMEAEETNMRLKLGTTGSHKPTLRCENTTYPVAEVHTNGLPTHIPDHLIPNYFPL